MRTDNIQENPETSKQNTSLSKESLLSVEETVSLASIFFHDIPCWQLKKTSINTSSIIMSVHSTQDSSRCPLCSVSSNKKQSCYCRKPQEQPLGDYNCRIHLTVHRFFCRNPECRREIFCERFENHLQTYQRCVDKVNEQILFTGLETGGSKGARLLNKSHIQMKRNSIIRSILTLSLPGRDTVENIGVDDWAKRKGHQYGSIIIDNDTHKPLDLLPHRESGCVGEALKDYTSLKTISSDRADCFSKAIHESCPEVKEIAERWHLSHNLSEAVQQAFRRYYKEIKGQLRTCKVEKRRKHTFYFQPK